jgi:hypothetical protein
MTNRELIETARQAMKDLSAENMLEHEQTAYNCLRLLCNRLDKIEIMRPVIEDMREDASMHISDGQAPHDCSWGYQEGVLIQNKQALDIYDACFK